jgi:tRNA-dihydrouridine synthase
MNSTKSAGLMIGRGAIGMPNIFYEIKRDLGWIKSPPPWKKENSAIARLWCWKRYLEISNEVYGDKMNKNIKRHAISFTKGLSGASAMRVKLHSVTTQNELGNKVTNYLESLIDEDANIYS